MTKLYSKLFEIQKLWLSVSKDGKNPHFKSAYPTLDNVISVLVPEANKIGLLITHFAENDVFVTRIVDVESQESIESRYTLLGTTPQQRGSEQTYFRRYSLIALFNLPTEDDDGNNFGSATPWKAYKKPILDQKTITDTIKKWKEWELSGTFDDFLDYLGKTHKVLDDQVARLKPLFPWI